MKQIVRGVCRLCRKEARLMNSHILSEFLYKPLYDKSHQFNVLSTSSKRARQTEQKGIREYLLCETCEALLSTWESYASRVLRGAKGRQIITNDPKGYSVRVDYEPFKLFELSILWRAAISQHPAFDDVQLAEHENRIRSMLLSSDPGRTDEYGCIVTESPINRDILDELIMNMGSVPVDGVICNRFIFAGKTWFFFLSRNVIDPRQRGLFLQEFGELRILRGDYGLSAFIKRAAIDLYNGSGRSPIVRKVSQRTEVYE